MPSEGFEITISASKRSRPSSQTTRPLGLAMEDMEGVNTVNDYHGVGILNYIDIFKIVSLRHNLP
jgi:hypothetical protein